MGLAATLVEFFLIGLATPLTAACALPLYPGFIVYLTSQAGTAGDGAGDGTDGGTAGDGGGTAGGGGGARASADAATADAATGTATGTGTDGPGGTTTVAEAAGGAGSDAGVGAGSDAGAGDDADGEGDDAGLSPGLVGVLVVGGVVAFMLALGLVFSFLLEASLTGVIGVVSPAAFAVLAVVSVALLLDADVFYRVPTVEPPTTSHPAGTAFAYGFFFGAVVVPCNPGLITFFLARQFLVTDPVGKLAGFLAFALGVGAPLLALALVSEAAGRRVTRALARRRTAINRVSGAVMLAVSAYYLLAVFDVLGIGSALGL